MMYGMLPFVQKEEKIYIYVCVYPHICIQFAYIYIENSGKLHKKLITMIIYIFDKEWELKGWGTG